MFSSRILFLNPAVTEAEEVREGHNALSACVSTHGLLLVLVATSAAGVTMSLSQVRKWKLQK